MADSTDGKTGPKENITLGIGLTVLTVAIFGLQDAVAKVLVQTWSPFQISMMRYWAFGLFSLYLVSRQAPIAKAFASKAPRLQMARGLLLLADVWLFGLAVKSVPLAELQAIMLLNPLLVTVFAIPLLGERVGIFRAVAVGAGFAGALIIVRPGGLPLDVGVLYAVAASTVFALYVVFTRKVARLDSTPTSMVYVGVTGMVASTAVGVFFWQPMDLMGIVLVLFVMVTTASAHMLMMVALRYAPASAVQPYNYFALPWAIVLSYTIFGHLIDPVSLIGAALIAGAGLFVWLRERRKASER